MTDQYFSLDRRGFYKIGGTLNLFKQNPLPNVASIPLPNGVTQPDLQKHLEELFPDGLSLHGWTYMDWFTDFINSRGVAYANYMVTLELVLEYVRRSFFADCPSRLQSYFAYTSLSEVQAFRQKQGAGEANAPIYRLQADKVIKVDQAWLRLGNQNIIGSFCAHQYWSGAASPNPEWEHALAQPILVVGQVA